MKHMNTRYIAIGGVMIALIAVITLLVRIPIPATVGYLNFSDVAVYFSGLAFGPIIGFVAGGVGTALADILGGYAIFAPVTLLAHGLQGLSMGWFGRNRKFTSILLGWVIGTLLMVAAYYIGETLMMASGILEAEAEGAITLWKSPALLEVPVNLLQNAFGGLVGVPLYYLVVKAYPPLERMSRSDTWEEEDESL